ncbi:MAG: SPOR domain-containing protein, partial [Candidatus Dadabacteria bacterium]
AGVLIVAALALAAAQVHMTGGPPSAVEAGVAGIKAPRLPAPAAAETRIAQQHRGTPRETFLGSRPYEIQIKPPPPPGRTLEKKPAAGPPAETGPAPQAPRAETEPAKAQAGVAAESSASSGKPVEAKAPGPEAQPAAEAPSAPVSKPWVSLQVGAFRNLKSAHALQRKLAKTFSDVYISTVESGGEPLYRVRVGRFRTPEETEALKKRLLAAGYPSFRVTER